MPGKARPLIHPTGESHHLISNLLLPKDTTPTHLTSSDRVITDLLWQSQGWRQIIFHQAGCRKTTTHPSILHCFVHCWFDEEIDWFQPRHSVLFHSCNSQTLPAALLTEMRRTRHCGLKCCRLPTCFCRRALARQTAGSKLSYLDRIIKRVHYRGAARLVSEFSSKKDKRRESCCHDCVIKWEKKYR